jgi:hypothetical protein
MGAKKSYIIPIVTLINLDNSITVMMVSNPTPQGTGNKGNNSNGTDKPFASPFGDKPFD